MITRYEFKERPPTNLPRIEDHSKEPQIYVPPASTNMPRVDSPGILESVIMDAAEFLDELVDAADEDLQDDIADIDYEQYYDDVLEYNNQVEEYNASLKGAKVVPKKFVQGFSKLEQLRRFWP